MPDNNEISIPLTADEECALSVGAMVLGTDSIDELAARALRRGIDLRVRAAKRHKGTVQALKPRGGGK